MSIWREDRVVSLAEIKKQANSLTRKERAELRAFLGLLDLKDDSARQAVSFAALDRAIAGEALAEKEVRRLIGKRPPSAA